MATGRCNPTTEIHFNDHSSQPTHNSMNWQTVGLVLLVILWAVAQYGLAAHALLDLKRRPTVRGNNKVVWALVILGVPIAGAFIYTVYGPTSFIRRGTALADAPSSPSRGGPQPLASRQERESTDHLPGGEPHVSRSERRTRQHAPPVEQLPNLPELADIDGEFAELRPQPTARRAANRLVRQAQRKIRR